MTSTLPLTKTLRWGPWVYDPSNNQLVLYYGRGDSLYWIDLDHCRTSSEVLDWIMQVQHKVFATPEVVGQLVRALDTLLRPQETLCSSGMNRTLDDPAAYAKAIATQVEAYRKARPFSRLSFGEIMERDPGSLHDVDE